MCYCKPTDLARRGSRYRAHPGPYPFDQRDLARICPAFLARDPDHDAVTERQYRTGELVPAALPLLLGLAAWLRPQTVVEVGTYTGKTAYLLARELPQSEVITIDCPREAFDQTTRIYSTDEAYLQAEADIGAAFRGTEAGARIVQVLADTQSEPCAAELDAKLAGRPIDFALIDASHSYDCVKHDFERLILPRLNPLGLIVLDDYNLLMTHSGVSLYLLEKAYRERFLFYWYAPEGAETNLVMFSPELNSIHLREVNAG
jgi:predicted O-methyltransferase YrrM